MSDSASVSPGVKRARVEAAARALENSRPNRLFDDPRASAFAGNESPSPGVAARIVVRTRWFDEQVVRFVHRGVAVVVSLRCGFDTRAWRLRCPDNVRWIGVDQADVVAHLPGAGALAGDVRKAETWSALDDVLGASPRLFLIEDPSCPELWARLRTRLPRGSAVLYASSSEEPLRWAQRAGLAVALHTQVGAQDAHYARLPGPVGMLSADTTHLVAVQTEPDEQYAIVEDPLSWFYDADYPPAPGERIDGYTGDDVDWCMSLAAQYGGPILDVGCGTGRLTLPLAQAGYQVTAIDSSRSMLAELGHKLGEHQVDVHCDDASIMSLQRRYALVLLSFNMLLLVEDQLALLERALGHLAEGGRVVVDFVDAATLDPDGRAAVATNLRCDRLGRRYVRWVGYSAMDGARRFQVHGCYAWVDNAGRYPFRIDMRGLDRATFRDLLRVVGLRIAEERTAGGRVMATLCRA